MSRVGWGHVERHVLDLPITQAAHQVIDLSRGHLPIFGEDTPQCWVVNEGVPSIGATPGGDLRTLHPRPRTIPSLSSPPTPEASLRQMTPPPKVHFESSTGHGKATSYCRGRRGKNVHSLKNKIVGISFFWKSNCEERWKEWGTKGAYL